MPYQIIQTCDLPKFIKDTIDGINEGVLQLVERGIDAQMPEKVDFAAIILSKPQAIAITTTSVKASTGTEGGSNNTLTLEEERATAIGSTSQTPNRTTTTTETGTTTPDLTTDDTSTQTTTHGETVNTSDDESTVYNSGNSEDGTPDPLG